MQAETLQCMPSKSGIFIKDLQRSVFQWKILNEYLINSYVSLMLPNKIKFSVSVWWTNFCLKLPQVHNPFSCKNPEHDFKTIPPSTFRWSNLTVITGSFMLLGLNVMKIWSLEEWKLCGPWYTVEQNSHFQLAAAQISLTLW